MNSPVLVNGKRLLAISAVAALIGARACGMAQAAGDTGWAGGDANAQAITELYDAAVAAKQDQLVIYGAYSAVYKPLWDIFHDRFSKTSIVGTPIAGAPLITKLDAEFASGQHVGDVLMAGEMEIMSLVGHGRTQPYRPPNIGVLAARYTDPQGNFIIQFADPFGIVYNTDKLKPEELPKSVNDLLNPKYKGMVIDDPFAGGATTLCWAELYRSNKLTPEQMKGIKGNANVVPSMTPLFQMLTAGSVAIMPWAGHSRQLRLKEAGAHVGYLAIPGMAVPLYGATALIKDAPHPKLAQLFQAWFLTPEAQSAIVKVGYSYGLMPGTTIPADWPDFQQLVDALQVVPPSDYVIMREQFDKAIRQVW
jgi:iron(III) transport system substrate-binding protein